jgi:hypothetical protein
MLLRFASTALVLGTLLTASIPAVGLAQNNGNRSGGNRSNYSRGSSGGNRVQSYGSGNRYTGRQSYQSPRGNSVRGGYSRGPSYYGRSYVTPRSYARPVYRRPYGGGVYLRFGAPYGYGYAPGYLYDPGYVYGPGAGYAPVPPPEGCPEGAYDQNGVWVPGPNCYSNQPYPPTQQDYDPNQSQDAPPQYYDPNAQRYPQQNIVPIQPQRSIR